MTNHYSTLRYQRGTLSEEDKKSVTKALIERDCCMVQGCAFKICQRLEEVEFEGGTVPVRIGSKAFYQCQALRTLILSERVTEINYGAFMCCKSLRKVEIPGSVEHVCCQSFAWCEKLEHVIIREGVKSIGACAFWKCKNLRTVELPTSLEEIHHRAFSHCKALQEIIFPGGLRIIGHTAFEGCLVLRKVQLPPSIEYIGPRAFHSCPHLEDELPEELNERGYDKVEGVGWQAISQMIYRRNINNTEWPGMVNWVGAHDTTGNMLFHILREHPEIFHRTNP